MNFNSKDVQLKFWQNVQIYQVCQNVDVVHIVVVLEDIEVVSLVVAEALIGKQIFIYIYI